MGGINHSPTSQVSLALTVPAAEALTQGMSELMLGNVSIERLVQLTGETHFGVGRSRLIEATAHFGGVVTQLEITRSYVRRLIDMVANPDYTPFDLSVVDVDSFIAECIVAGLLIDSAATNSAVEVIKSQGYNGIFFAISDLIEDATAKAKQLRDVTNVMVDGPEGTQGYFWANVEANRNTWRQDFMTINTAMTYLIAFWATTAAVCTEVHLKGIQAPSLLERISAHSS